MATEKTDVVIIGVGAAGGVLAAELGKAGMKVIGLERGPRLTTQDFNPHDELRYFTRQDLRPNIKRQPVTWRPNANARANPIPVQNYGNQAGGGTVHYGAVSWRFHEDDFRARSQTIERYGASAIPEDSSLVDWPRATPISSPTTIASNRSEEHTSELQSRLHLVCRLLLEKKKIIRDKDYMNAKHTILHMNLLG